MVITVDYSQDPFGVFAKFYGQKGLFFLDSSQKGLDGRLSHMGFAPFKVVVGRDIAKLRKEFAQYRVRASCAVLPGGAVGYWEYDGEFYFGFYDQVLTFDNKEKTLCVYAPTRRRINEILDIVHRPSRGSPWAYSARNPFVLKSNFTKSQYIVAVKKTLDYIRRGDIYQANLSRKVEVVMKNPKMEVDAGALYAALRRRSCAPFGAYFEGGDQTILSSSPERLVKLSGRIAQVKPMKGTMPRGQNKAQDARHKDRLRHSAKEAAELLMVTDMERNDLGKVCSYGSVHVKTLRAIETYPTVFQATSTIEGRLGKGCDAFDLLQAVFPGGSVTGCPKIKAMAVLERLERAPRQAYTGALGYIGFSGHMDFSVLIRSFFIRRHKIAFHVGGGVVADSNPAQEYQETCVKAQAMQDALREAMDDF